MNRRAAPGLEFIAASTALQLPWRVSLCARFPGTFFSSPDQRRRAKQHRGEIVCLMPQEKVEERVTKAWCQHQPAVFIFRHLPADASHKGISCSRRSARGHVCPPSTVNQTCKNQQGWEAKKSVLPRLPIHTVRRQYAASRSTGGFHPVLDDYRCNTAAGRPLSRPFVGDD